MKKLSSPIRMILFAIIGISSAFLSVAFGTSSAVPQATTATPTPTLSKAELALEVGSTDGIILWAIAIALFIIIPILWHWIQWKREEK
ncbi:MAG: hypothetical protein HN392_02445 [Anaerolineae bacterium]|nr:hypothetical protein [Anaerolineae bacterium]